MTRSEAKRNRCPTMAPWMERRAAPGPLARGFARRARRAAGCAKPAKGRFASALAPSRRSIPLGETEKGKTACPAPIKE